jgi:hypothetical protein
VTTAEIASRIRASYFRIVYARHLALDKRASRDRCIAGEMPTSQGPIPPSKPDSFRLADYALRDSIPSRPSPIGRRGVNILRSGCAAMQAQIANSLCMRENHPSR